MKGKSGLRIACCIKWASNIRKYLVQWMGGWMDGWVGGCVDGWMDGGESRVKDCLQQSKIKFLIISKFNFNEGQFYKKISNFDYFKK